ncbi:MAG: hypothetical protein GXY34_10235, partial [Syntrophomonadaceae bacterium]|nr:hypothetical protein [Syntrophomonadaceae bacterium]
FILRTIFLSALGVTIIGILAAASLINYPQAFFDNHIASTMGYHNTLATFLVAAILIGLSLLAEEKNRWWQLLYSISNYFMMLVIMAAVSKGAWLILVLGVVMMFIGMPQGYRMKVFYYLFLAVAPAIIISNYFMTAIFSAKPSTGMVFVIVGITLVMGGWFLWRYIDSWLNSVKLSRPAVIGLITMIIILLILTINLVGLSDRITKEISEVTDIQHLSYVTRVDFMRWAIDIIQDYPITGAGAGGWAALYRQYQDYQFWSAEAHSHIFQVGVEAGLMGVLAFSSIWMLFIILLYRLYIIHRDREEKEEWILICGAAVAAIGLGIHSCFDFDLSLPSMAILLWSLFALISAFYQQHSREFRIKISRSWINVAISALLLLILYISSCQYLLAHFQFQTGLKKFQAAQADQQVVRSEQLLQAGTHFSQAVINDSLNAEYWSYLAYWRCYCCLLFNEQDQEKAATFREKSIVAANQALDLDPYNAEINQRLMQNLVNMGDPAGAIRSGRLLIKTMPNDPQSYVRTTELWWYASQYFEKNGRHDFALDFAGEIIMLDEALQNQLKKVEIDHPLWQGEKLTTIPEYEQIYRQARDFITADRNEK